MIDIFDLTWM